MKTRIITWLVTLAAFLDTAYAVLADNSGMLAEIGVSPKATKVVLLVGIIWTAFSKSLKPEKPTTFADGDDAPIDPAGQGEIISPKPPRP